MSNNTSSFSGCIGQIDMSLSNTASRRTSRLTCLHTLPLQSHIHPNEDFYSLSLRLLSVGIAFNVLEGRSFTPCPPFPLHSHPPFPQFTLRLNCSNHPTSNKNLDTGLSENPEPEKDTVFSNQVVDVRKWERN